MQSVLQKISELDQRIITLDAQVQQNKTDIEAANIRIEALNNAITSINERLGKHDERLDSIVGALNDINDKIETKYNELNTKIGELAQAVSQHNDQIAALQSAVATNTAAIASLQNQMNNKADKSEVDALKEQIAALQQKVRADSTVLDQLIRDQIALVQEELDKKASQEAVDAVNQRVDDLEGRVAGLEDRTSAMLTKLGDLEDAYKAADQQLSDRIDALKDDVETNAAAISTLDQKVNVLQGDVEKIKTYLKSQVTSVVVEGTYNNVFGYANLPVGLQSNILAGFYGKVEQDVEFPTADEALGEAMTPEDFMGLGGDAIEGYYVKSAGGKLLNDKDKGVYVGRLYVTVNPSGVDFNGKSLALQNSRGEAANATLLPLQKADDVLLSFGIGKTRSVANGFYQADAYVPESKIDNARMTLTSEMKSNMKDMLKSIRESIKHRKLIRDFSLSKLAQATYKQINALFGDAYAVKATYEDMDGNEQNVLSGYDVASRVISPLSYDFLKDRTITLPKISPLHEIKISDWINFKGININVDDIVYKKIEFNDLDTVFVTMDITVPVPDTDNVTITAVVTDNGSTGTGTGHLEDFDSETGEGKVVVDNVTLDINVTADIDEVNIPTKDSLWTVTVPVPLDVVNNRIRDLVDGVNGNVDSLIQQIKDKMAGINESLDLSSAQSKIDGYVDRVNNIINRVNSWIVRMNDYINHANGYLQPVLMYDGKDGYMHQVSEYKKLPTRVKLDAAGNGVLLTPTSRTAELVAPAFKKFVAVTNVWDKKGNLVESAKQAANNVEFMNTVLPGTQNAVVFAPQATAGYTYEIVYQAMDYSGKVRTNKYYIKVVK
jgi:predicted  nucleic acid-binding Zn-ribbon protein